MKIIINQPRASYFVGGAEMISIDHAINLYEIGNDIYFFTISPKSVGLNYSERFQDFYVKYSNKIHIIEINQSIEAKSIYKIEPGENRCRWNVESIFYNQILYEYLIKKNKSYDVMLSYYNLDAVFVPKKLILNNVLYLCGTPKIQSDFQGSFLYPYDNIISISLEVKESWKKYSLNEISVISTGVDCNKFPLKKNISLNKNNINILYVGRLIKRKNVDKIIYAFQKLNKILNLKLVIVGDGPDRSRLEKISKDVIFTGTKNDTKPYYNNADIFISPSSYGEGLQGTILEAMSCGLVVLASNTVINKKLLADGRGIIINANQNSIIEAINKSLKLNRSEVSKKCRKYILENYNWKNKTKELLEVIK